jgi:hypothetical protein
MDAASVNHFVVAESYPISGVPARRAYVSFAPTTDRGRPRIGDTAAE